MTTLFSAATSIRGTENKKCLLNISGQGMVVQHPYIMQQPYTIQQSQPAPVQGMVHSPPPAPVQQVQPPQYTAAPDDYRPPPYHTDTTLNNVLRTVSK